MKAVNPDVSLPQLEEEILRFWRDEEIFQKSLDPNLTTSLDGESTGPRSSYVFYDGPPFATGLPHYGHLLAGTIKDVVGRFFTMKGFHVDRRFGWDCHGVPVEFEIQKTLDLHGAKAIREYGVGRFNEECRSIVLRYTKEWEKFVERSGRWVDFTRQYRTMDLEFMESVWWAVRSLWDRGLLYEGLKCVPYSYAINTPLSNFEANLNYKDVQDPAVTVRAQVLEDVRAVLNMPELPELPVFAYAWTTTPWTLPSNMAFAVGKDIDYVVVENLKNSELVIVAEERVEVFFPGINDEDASNEESSPKILARMTGEKLAGLSYRPFFSYFESEREKNAFRFYLADFVTADEGTGVVHCASFGEDDVSLFLANGITPIDPVDEDGQFTDQVPDFSGINVKDADPKIIAALKESGLLVQHKTIEHSYPFCWRTDTPLIYKTIPTWFVKVESLRDELVQVNKLIHWVPGHLRDGRFGKWLEGARDWAISRNRFWGTPLPVWRCEGCNETTCLGSVQELEKLAGVEVKDLHSHFIDELTFPCDECGGVKRRIPEVLDCWFESGAMPYAQAHYPVENKSAFEESFPADFIAEGLDQTRGWFYTLLVLSTALFGRPAFRNVIVNGIVLAEDGKKMSKSLKNYPPPEGVMDEFGADAMRLYLLASAATRGEDLRFSKTGVKHVVRQTLLPLWNAYNFLVTYARVDGWTPEDYPSEPSENILDQWILSKVGSLVSGVDAALESYHLYAATQPVLEFVDQLTNWYIRLNRRRFWGDSSSSVEKGDKLHAYATLHRVILTFVRVLAPMAPFISEAVFRNLRIGVKGADFKSVHLMPFPTVDEIGASTIQLNLETAMELFEEVILLGRSLRNSEGHKVRQPLKTLTVIHPDGALLRELLPLEAYLKDELNVKEIVYTSEEEAYVSLSAQLNTKALGKVLGPKLGSKGMRELRNAVEAFSTEEIRSLERGGAIKLPSYELSLDDIVIRRTIKSGVDAAACSGQVTIMLDTTINRELRLEGLAREFVNRVQKARKDSGFDVSDRVFVKYMTACPQLALAMEEYRSYIMGEILAVDMSEVKDQQDMSPGGTSTSLPMALEIGGKTMVVSVARIQS